jgi:hypothetical protein
MLNLTELKDNLMDNRNFSVLDTLKEHDRDFKISMINAKFDTTSRHSIYNSTEVDNI